MKIKQITSIAAFILEIIVLVLAVANITRYFSGYNSDFPGLVLMTGSILVGIHYGASALNRLKSWI